MPRAFSIAACAFLAASAGAIPLSNTSANMESTGPQMEPMAAYAGAPKPLAIWAPNPATTESVLTSSSSRTDGMTGRSFAVFANSTWLSYPDRYFVRVTEAPLASELEDTDQPFIPTNGLNGIPRTERGMTVWPKLTLEASMPPYAHGPCMMKAVSPSLNMSSMLPQSQPGFKTEGALPSGSGPVPPAGCPYRASCMVCIAETVLAELIVGLPWSSKMAPPYPVSHGQNWYAALYGKQSPQWLSDAMLTVTAAP